MKVELAQNLFVNDSGHTFVAVPITSKNKGSDFAKQIEEAPIFPVICDKEHLSPSFSFAPTALFPPWGSPQLATSLGHRSFICSTCVDVLMNC